MDYGAGPMSTALECFCSTLGCVCVNEEKLSMDSLAEYLLPMVSKQTVIYLGKIYLASDGYRVVDTEELQ